MSIREREIARYSEPVTLWDLVEAILCPLTGLDRIDDKFFLERHADSAAKLATKSSILEILTGMELDVIHGLVQGDLPERARDDLSTYFDNESRVGDDIPARYVNYIVDADGRAPTKADVRRR